VRKPWRLGAFAPEHRVRGSRSGTLDLGGRDPTDATVEARLVEDRLREVGPGAVAVRRQMPEPLRPVVDDERDASTYLVYSDGSHQIQHELLEGGSP